MTPAGRSCWAPGEAGRLRPRRTSSLGLPHCSLAKAQGPSPRGQPSPSGSSEANPTGVDVNLASSLGAPLPEGFTEAPQSILWSKAGMSPPPKGAASCDPRRGHRPQRWMPQRSCRPPPGTTCPKGGQSPGPFGGHHRRRTRGLDVQRQSPWAGGWWPPEGDHPPTKQRKAM